MRKPGTLYIVAGIVIGISLSVAFFSQYGYDGIATQAQTSPGLPPVTSAYISAEDVYPMAENPDPQQRKYTLIAQDAEIEVANGVSAKVWTFNGTVPAPTIRFNEGDNVTVKFINETPYAHTIHFHGSHNSANDGVIPQVLPGKQYTYNFVAHEAGLFMYHCHAFPTTEHVRMGMFGAMIVDPVHHPMKNAREYVLVLSEFDPDNALAEFTRFYPINGYANQYMDSPIQVRENETARFYVIGIGGVIQSPFHLHSTIFKVWPSGILWNAPHHAQTHLIANGDTAIIEASWKEAGRYMFHVHGIQEERGSMAILDVLDDDSTLQERERPSNMPGSKSMIEWQESLIKELEKPKIIRYNLTTTPSNTSQHAAQGVVGDKVSIAKGSSDPKMTDSYNPGVVKAAAGTTITWKNDDAMIHTVTETVQEGQTGFDSGLMQAGAQWSHTFEEEGKYDYFCLLHPWMKGTVMIE